MIINSASCGTASAKPLVRKRDAPDAERAVVLDSTRAGPQLQLKNDTDLGANWSDYPYADPVVRSLNATVYRRLAQGESHLFATVLHGSADGKAEPWDIEHLEKPKCHPPEGRLRQDGHRPGAHRTADLPRNVQHRRRLLILDGTDFRSSRPRRPISMVLPSTALLNRITLISPFPTASAIDGLPAVQPAAVRGMEAKMPAQKLIWEKSIADAVKTPDAAAEITRLAVASLDGPSQTTDDPRGNRPRRTLRPEQRRKPRAGR